MRELLSAPRKPESQTKEKYLMIQKLKITNFRCFKRLELNDLKQFNVMVGPSGSGKTAFLEAIFLAGAGSAESLPKDAEMARSCRGAVFYRLQSFFRVSIPRAFLRV